MLSTHFREPQVPQQRELQFLDLLARLAADYLERKRSEDTEKLLLREVQHRSNNLLTVVQAAGGGRADLYRDRHIRIVSP